MKNGPTTRARDTTRALCPQRTRALGVGQLPRGPRSERPQRLRDQSQRAEVGAGADHDGRAALTQPPDRGLQVAHRVAHRHPVGDVVAADDDHRDVRGVRRRQRVELRGQHRRLRPDDGGGPQPDRPLRPLRELPGQPAPSVSLARSAPRPAAIESPRSSRCTGSLAPLAPCAVGVDRGLPEGLPMISRARAAWDRAAGGADDEAEAEQASPPEAVPTRTGRDGHGDD